MNLFDVPNTGYGVHTNNDFVYCLVSEYEADQIKSLADQLGISHQRWFMFGREITRSEIGAGILFYSYSYNCIRLMHKEIASMIKLVSYSEFISKLRRWKN